jgi:competence protein ComEC
LAEYDPWQYRKVTISARAMNDAAYGKGGQLAFDAGHVVLPDRKEPIGKVQISGFGANAVFQGDDVTVTGKLYPGYGAYQGRISYAQFNVSARHTTLVEIIRQRFTAGMQTALPEPLASFAMGLLVGQRVNLPEQAKQDLLMVGLTHIIAVSGYNLTIILHACRGLLGNRSKRIATGLSLLLIGVFLLITGASASIVRAAIVSVLSIVARYYGRTFKPLNLLFLTAAVTAWANPVYVWSDLSWYLSFLAFFGVMIISPAVQSRWPGGWHRTLLGGVALESMCAGVMTEPFVLYVFGQMSFISLPANMLVVTLIPLAMLLGLVAGLAGMCAAGVAGWFALPAVWLLNYMLDIAHLLANLPHVFIQNRSLSLAAMLSIYGAVIGVCLVLRHKTNAPESAIITDRKQRILEGAMT